MPSISRTEQSESAMHLNFWSFIFIATVFMGVMGWALTIPIINGTLWLCDWKDGVEMNWGSEVIWTCVGPFAWLFAIFEIIMLYAN